MQNFRVLNQIKSFFQNMYAKNKKLFYVMIALVIVLVVGFVLPIFSSGKSSSKIESEENVSISTYTSNLENKLESMLLKIKSISEVDVLVLAESTPQVNYLKETEETEITNANGSTKTTTTKVVYEKDGSATKPIVVSTTMPKISGVLIVTNKINASTKLSIINSVSIVLNVDESCITILQER